MRLGAVVLIPQTCLKDQKQKNLPQRNEWVENKSNIIYLNTPSLIDVSDPRTRNIFSLFFKFSHLKRFIKIYKIEVKA